MVFLLKPFCALLVSKFSKCETNFFYKNLICLPKIAEFDADFKSVEKVAKPVILTLLC
jgi:hypothetical protein